MNRRTSARIAAIALFTLGFIEMSAVMALVSPKELVASLQLPWELGFGVALSTLFGVSRLVAGYGVWSMRKWGIIFGIILSGTTLVVAPSVYRAGVTGIIDLLLAIVALVSLLYTWFANEVIVIRSPGS